MSVAELVQKVLKANPEGMTSTALFLQMEKDIDKPKFRTDLRKQMSSALANLKKRKLVEKVGTGGKDIGGNQNRLVATWKLV